MDQKITLDFVSRDDILSIYIRILWTIISIVSGFLIKIEISHVHGCRVSHSGFVHPGI